MGATKRAQKNTVAFLAVVESKTGRASERKKNIDRRARRSVGGGRANNRDAQHAVQTHPQRPRREHRDRSFSDRGDKEKAGAGGAGSFFLVFGSPIVARRFAPPPTSTTQSIVRGGGATNRGGRGSRVGVGGGWESKKGGGSQAAKGAEAARGGKKSPLRKPNKTEKTKGPENTRTNVAVVLCGMKSPRGEGVAGGALSRLSSKEGKHASRHGLFSSSSSSGPRRRGQQRPLSLQ